MSRGPVLDALPPASIDSAVPPKGKGRRRHGGGARAANNGAFIVDNRPSFSCLTSRYDDFLYATVCLQANGTQLSVLSALARMDVDPWQEATRLAAMPKVIAERSLVTILDVVSRGSWNQSEAEVVAARLIRLLPQLEKADAIAATQVAISEIRARRLKYWLVWLGVAIVISVLAPRYHATPTDTSGSMTNSGVLVPLQSRTPNSPPAGAPDQLHDDHSGAAVK